MIVLGVTFYHTLKIKKEASQAKIGVSLITLLLVDGEWDIPEEKITH